MPSSSCGDLLFNFEHTLNPITPMYHWWTLSSIMSGVYLTKERRKSCRSQCNDKHARSKSLDLTDTKLVKAGRDAETNKCAKRIQQTTSRNPCMGLTTPIF